ncbi:MAG: carbon monoxide dehydrogenase [Betaproteobacteria bacterium RIFCSPLOWO2_12_FULL_62_58]|nr:MAG: carbon monoxide dehydrogenase [Betaproteobacteria bacterium RIFCSPLOWO2_02_FULL_62_79]OGA53304.1 MAG: carbon monoxide dehydrogenase [Betaproteobacteria bacterium RIFCSPLOWO2_12_FULL_62_58]
MKIKAEFPLKAPYTDYIGVAVPRPDARRLLQGRGRYVDDIRLPRMAHVVFVRSPYAHARIVNIDVSQAAVSPGVIRVVSGSQVARVCRPWVGVLTHLKGLKSAPQHPLAIDRACWQGEAVAAVAAETRAQAEDAVQLVNIEWQELPAVTDPETALEPETPVIHPELGDNLAYQREVDTGDTEEAFARAYKIAEATFRTSRHTAVTLEPRSILADFNPAERQLTVYHSTQVPYMMQWILAKHFELPEVDVRVIAPDVGGGFGAKIHIYGDEMTTVALSLMLGRPVKFVADRLESFVTDFHARGHCVKARMAVSKAGDILGIEIDDLYGIGPYSGYPRGSANEAQQVINLVGGPYKNRVYRGRTRVVFQNKNMYGQYRAVGHPVACAVTEGLVDFGAAAIGMDPAEFRRRNYIPADAYPYTLVTGPVFEKLSQHEAHDKLLKLMNYAALRAEQAALRQRGIYRGIGLAAFVEMSNPSAATYGKGGASIAAQDGCTIKLTATGGITCAASINEIGQGAATIVAQIAASAVSVALDKVKVVIGDTEVTPYGGGNWGSRGTGIGGEAVLRAGKALRQNILTFVARLTETEASLLDIRHGKVVDAATGAERMTLEEVARTAYFRSDKVPPDFSPELAVTRHYAQKTYDGICTNGIQGCYLEVDVETGFVKLLRHWVVDDCGTVINPLLVDEQIRGAVVQGFGAALFEECIYSPEGQLSNGSLIDYLVPMAREMPDIEISHTSTPTATSELGAKGVGEAGTAGSPAAVMNAINDALKPFGARVMAQPFTPERILRALGKI